MADKDLSAPSSSRGKVQRFPDGMQFISWLDSLLENPNVNRPNQPLINPIPVEHEAEHSLQEDKEKTKEKNEEAAAEVTPPFKKMKSVVEQKSSSSQESAMKLFGVSIPNVDGRDDDSMKSGAVGVSESAQLQRVVVAGPSQSGASSYTGADNRNADGGLTGSHTRIDDRNADGGGK